MKDHILQDLAVDDFVVYSQPDNGGMAAGKIVGFTPKKVRISYISWRGSTTRLIYPCNVAKVDGHAALIYILKK